MATIARGMVEGWFDNGIKKTKKYSTKLTVWFQATGQRVGVCLQGVGSVGIAFVLAALYEWRVGLVALSFLPLVVIVIHYQSKATNKESFGNAKALENSTKVTIHSYIPLDPVCLVPFQLTHFVTNCT